MGPRVTKAQPSLPALSILRACGVQTEKTGVWVTVPSWFYPPFMALRIWPVSHGKRARAGLSAPLQVGQGGLPEAGPAFLNLANRGHSTPGLQLSHLVRTATSLVSTHKKAFLWGRNIPTKTYFHLSSSPTSGSVFLQRTLSTHGCPHQSPDNEARACSQVPQASPPLSSSQVVKKPFSDSGEHHPIGMKPEKLESLAQGEKK